jgi:hypothetical protein
VVYDIICIEGFRKMLWDLGSILYKMEYEEGIRYVQEKSIERIMGDDLSINSETS